MRESSSLVFRQILSWQVSVLHFRHRGCPKGLVLEGWRIMGLSLGFNFKVVFYIILFPRCSLFYFFHHVLLFLSHIFDVTMVVVNGDDEGWFFVEWEKLNEWLCVGSARIVMWTRSGRCDKPFIFKCTFRPHLFFCKCEGVGSKWFSTMARGRQRWTFHVCGWREFNLSL